MSNTPPTTAQSWGSADELRAAATLRATLSGQLMAAALAVLGVEGAVVVYGLNKGLPLIALLAALTASLAFCIGIFTGGRACEAVASTIERGLKSGERPADLLAQRRFRRQSELNFVGLLALFVMVIATVVGRTEPPDHLVGLEAQLKSLVDVTKRKATAGDVSLRDALEHLHALDRASQDATRRIGHLEEQLRHLSNGEGQTARKSPGPR